MKKIIFLALFCFMSYSLFANETPDDIKTLETIMIKMDNIKENVILLEYKNADITEKRLFLTFVRLYDSLLTIDLRLNSPRNFSNLIFYLTDKKNSDIYNKYLSKKKYYFEIINQVLSK